MNRSRSALISFAVVALCAACGSPEREARFDHLEYAEISLAPTSVELEPKSITLTEGTAVKAVVRAVDSKGGEMSPLDLAAEDLAILGAEPGPEEDTFVIYGSGAGQTQLHVIVGGRDVGSVNATVLAQVE